MLRQEVQTSSDKFWQVQTSSDKFRQVRTSAPQGVKRQRCRLEKLKLSSACHYSAWWALFWHYFFLVSEKLAGAGKSCYPRCHSIARSQKLRLLGDEPAYVVEERREVESTVVIFAVCPLGQTAKMMTLSSVSHPSIVSQSLHESRQIAVLTHLLLLYCYSTATLLLLCCYSTATLLLDFHSLRCQPAFGRLRIKQNSKSNKFSKNCIDLFNLIFLRNL